MKGYRLPDVTYPLLKASSIFSMPPAYPSLFRVRQHFAPEKVADVPTAVTGELDRMGLASRVRQGESVAITAGSRGIANLPAILRAAVGFFVAAGARPFVVPAMGSHGGGTAEGQTALLARYGITEEAIGCPIRSSMETVVLCQAPEGFAVHFDRLAAEADHVLVVNRVKSHTRFVGEIESGLMKMLLIGLGKKAGAEVYHRAIQQYSFAQIIASVAGAVRSRCPILAGLAVVENAYEETARIEGVFPEAFETRERALLAEARRLTARLPFDDVDLLLVDRIGKEISGTGMDTNVVGRKFNDREAAAGELPRVKWIAVRGLSQATGGNAVGLGIAELCRSRVLRAMDAAATRINAVTAGHLPAAMVPLDYETDREILDAALATIGLVEPADARVLWISDTLHLAEVDCSAAYYEEALRRHDLSILAEPAEMPLDARGCLPERARWHRPAGPPP